MSEKKTDTRSRVWTFLIYPESAPQDIKKIISDNALVGALSPLHDSDKNDDGSLKKPHYHCVLQFDGKKSQKQVQEISDLFSGVLPIRVMSLNGSVRYLTHMDDSDKAQYSSENVYVFGGFDYEKHIQRTNKRDIDDLRTEIIKFIISEDVCEYADLVEKCFIEGNVEYLDYITDKSNYWITQYISSRRGRSSLALQFAKRISELDEENKRVERAREVCDARETALDLFQAGIHFTSAEQLAKYVYSIPDGMRIPNRIEMIAKEMKKLLKTKE